MRDEISGIGVTPPLGVNWTFADGEVPPEAIGISASCLSRISRSWIALRGMLPPLYGLSDLISATISGPARLSLRSLIKKSNLSGLSQKGNSQIANNIAYDWRKVAKDRFANSNGPGMRPNMLKAIWILNYEGDRLPIKIGGNLGLKFLEVAARPLYF